MAGAIKTGVVTKEYEDGWERTFGEESMMAYIEEEHKRVLEQAEADLLVALFGESAPEHEQLAVTHAYTYDCPVCGWHRTHDDEPCGNATCRTYKSIRGGRR